MPHSDLPALDVHAHIAGDVNQTQLDDLEGAVVFAMTRSHREAAYAIRPGGAGAANVMWSIGVHPGVPASVEGFDETAFAALISAFAVVGEVGLDRRGDQTAQRRVLDSVLQACSAEPVLISVHSAGRTSAILDAVAAHPHPGVILHWFNGTADEIRRAADLGCYFSVNAAMADDQLRSIPAELLLTETDFPASSRRTGAARPGDTAAIEQRLGALHATPVRNLVWRNLARIVAATGADARLSPNILRYLD